MAPSLRVQVTVQKRLQLRTGGQGEWSEADEVLARLLGAPKRGSGRCQPRPQEDSNFSTFEEVEKSSPSSSSSSGSASSSSTRKTTIRAKARELRAVVEEMSSAIDRRQRIEGANGDFSVLVNDLF